MNDTFLKHLIDMVINDSDVLFNWTLITGDDTIIHFSVFVKPFLLFTLFPGPQVYQEISKKLLNKTETWKGAGRISMYIL